MLCSTVNYVMNAEHVCACVCVCVDGTEQGERPRERERERYTLPIYHVKCYSLKKRFEVKGQHLSRREGICLPMLQEAWLVSVLSLPSYSLDLIFSSEHVYVTFEGKGQIVYTQPVKSF